MTGQVSFSFVDWAVGQPHNPSYLPFALTDWHAPLSFPKRVVTAIATMVFEGFR